MCRTVVVNLKRDVCDVSIARPGPWDNPFIIGRDGTRDEVIEKYERWVRQQPQLLERLPELKGKRLGCFCSPLPCHGDVLVQLIGEIL